MHRLFTLFLYSDLLVCFFLFCLFIFVIQNKNLIMFFYFIVYSHWQQLTNENKQTWIEIWLKVKKKEG